MGEVSESYSGGTPSVGNKSYYGGSIPFIRSAEINSESTELFLTEEGLTDSSARMVSKGDILYALYGATSGETGRSRINGAINQAILAILPHDGYDSEFLMQWLRKSKQNITDIYLQGGQGNLSGAIVKALEVNFPSLAEQRQIGNYFQSIDHLIILHQQKITLLIKLKKAMLEKMFPKKGSVIPEIRFNGFANAWEQRKLENLGKATGGTSIESEFSEDGIYKVISIGSYSENSVYNDQGIRAIKSDKTSNRVLNKNDLTMILNDKTTSGNIIGRVLLIEKSGIYVYNQRTERIEININEYDPVFLYEMLNAPNIREKIIKQAQGNTQIYVNWSTIAMLDYMIPSKKEQVKIGQFLHSISNIITLHQRKIYKIKNMKKAMLDQMFI